MLYIVTTGMPSEQFIQAMLYLALMVVGISGNTAVILAFLLLIYKENVLLTADAIVLHLACANLLLVAVRCLLETLASFELTNIFRDAGCKSVTFIQTLELSVWLTFLLSVYQ